LLRYACSGCAVLIRNYTIRLSDYSGGSLDDDGELEMNEGEIVGLTTGPIDSSGEAWGAELVNHKNVGVTGVRYIFEFVRGTIIESERPCARVEQRSLSVLHARQTGVSEITWE